MRTIFLLTSGLLAAWCVLRTAEASQVPPSPQNLPPKADAWATERIELVDGRTYHGLIESEEDAWLNLIEIRRPQARPMHVVIRPISRTSIAKVVRLDPQPRAELRGRVEEFIHRAEIEAGRMEAVRLQTVEKDGRPHFLYRGRWFLLEATTDEPTTRRLIVRIEQRFTGYRQILPPRVQPERPLRIMVFGSLAEYEASLASLGLAVGNRAVFLQEENLVAAGSELGRYTAERAELEATHQKLREELKQLEDELARRLRRLSDQLRRQGGTRSQVRTLLAREKRTVQDQIDRKLDELAACNRQNDRALDQVAGQMLTRLYHEAFHAYLENYVYPRQIHDVPHWLNEGLAMLFEAALAESGDLRLDAPNRTALAELQADLKSGRPLSLQQLLTADARDFLVQPGASSETSNRYYAHAWGLVYYLTFEKHLLTSPALDAYVVQEAEPPPLVVRFENMVGMPLTTFEAAWREDVAALR